MAKESQLNQKFVYTPEGRDEQQPGFTLFWEHTVKWGLSRQALSTHSLTGLRAKAEQAKPLILMAVLSGHFTNVPTVG